MDEVSLSSVVRLFQMTAADTAHALVPIIFIVRRADSFMVSQMQMKKKHSERRKHCALAVCSKAEPKKIRPAADPLPWWMGRPKFNPLQMVTTFTY